MSHRAARKVDSSLASMLRIRVRCMANFGLLQQSASTKHNANMAQARYLVDQSIRLAIALNARLMAACPTGGGSWPKAQDAPRCAPQVRQVIPKRPNAAERHGPSKDVVHLHWKGNRIIILDDRNIFQPMFQTWGNKSTQPVAAVRNKDRHPPDAKFLCDFGQLPNMAAKRASSIHA
jgi:hypothetical protein